MKKHTHQGNENLLIFGHNISTASLLLGGMGEINKYDLHRTADYLSVFQHASEWPHLCQDPVYIHRDTVDQGRTGFSELVPRRINAAWLWSSDSCWQPSWQAQTNHWRSYVNPSCWWNVFQEREILCINLRCPDQGLISKHSSSCSNVFSDFKRIFAHYSCLDFVFSIWVVLN